MLGCFACLLVSLGCSFSSFSLCVPACLPSCLPVSLGCLFSSFSLCLPACLPSCLLACSLGSACFLLLSFGLPACLSLLGACSLLSFFTGLLACPLSCLLALLGLLVPFFSLLACLLACPHACLSLLGAGSCPRLFACGAMPGSRVRRRRRLRRAGGRLGGLVLPALPFSSCFP